MKKLLLFIFFIFFAISNAFAFDTDFYDVEYDLDSLEKLESIKTQGGSFKPEFVSDEQFNQAIEQMKGKPRKPWKFTKWLFGIKDEPEVAPSNTPAGPSEFDLLRETIKSNNLISLFLPVVDDFGHIVPIGHYTVIQQSANGQNYILLKQINKTFGCFKAYEEKDEGFEGAVVYSRAVHSDNSEFIKIIYSDFDKTFKANVKILK